MRAAEREKRAAAAAGSGEAREAARVGGAMLLAGGSLSLILCVLVPNYANGRIGSVVSVSMVAVVAGGFCLRRPGQVPRWALPMLAPFGTLLISLACLLSRSPADGSELLYMWPALYTAYFFPMRVAFANVALISATYTPIAISVLGYAKGTTPTAYLIGTSIVTVLIVATLRRRLDNLLAASALDARTDRLTGLVNRRGWDEALAHETSRQRAAGWDLSLLMIDLDHFKQLNDTHGHSAGDAALARVANELRAAARQSDVLARLGGEEFGVLLPGCSSTEAVAVAEELRRRLEKASEAWPTPVTVSIGVASLPEHSPTADGLLHVADLALYDAKRLGRNRVSTAAPSESTNTARRRAGIAADLSLE